jgi:hypothetical protein
MSHSQRVSSGWWLGTALLLAVLYPLSLGPVVMISTKLGDPDWFTGPAVIVYYPVLWTAESGPEPIQRVIEQYVELWD